jgi:Domain of unknown function (DUF4411)
MADDLYCFDASSIIRLKQDFPRKIFPAVWERVEELIRTKRLIAPDEVYREIEHDDVLGPWAKQRKRMFVRPDQQQVDAAKDVASHFPSLAKPGRFGPAADPFVVALAHLENQKRSGLLYAQAVKCVVVTEERGPASIPGACSHYKLTCIPLVGVFEREGWVFR